MAKRILLADDSITIQKVVELTFSDGDYEVTAVNNGAKAVQKLSEMRPDIILSDIIMPEKNGYEVCEYVKSHPDFRNIPVILLTGTFEPFDPDRADKAGCDAVVTKPFESQSLISKVEELVAQAKANAPTAPQPIAQPEPPAFAPEPFEPEPPTAPAAAPFAGGFEPQGADIFGAPQEPAFGGETRAFPRMSFDELSQAANQPAAAPPPPPEPSPWDEAPATGGETRAFPRMSFDELSQAANQPAAAPPPPPEPSPWDEAPATGGETRAFPRMSFDELSQMANQQPAAPVTPEPSPWDEGPQESAAAGDTMSPFAAEPVEPPPAMPEPSPWDEAPAFGGETRAFPRMSFDELQQLKNAPAAEPEPEPAPPAPEPSPWDEAPAFGGETRAFPKMSFDDLQQMASQPAAEPEPEPAPSWSPAEEPAPAESFTTEAASPFAESLADQEAPFEPEVTPPLAVSEPEPAWSPTASAASFAAEPTEINSQITDLAAEPTKVNPQTTDLASVNPQITDLTDDQVDRIARRVVQLISEQVIRNIAWEVIPDMAEMVVKERIRQLEAQDS